MGTGSGSSSARSASALAWDLIAECDALRLAVQAILLPQPDGAQGIQRDVGIAEMSARLAALEGAVVCYERIAATDLKCIEGVRSLIRRIGTEFLESNVSVEASSGLLDTVHQAIDQIIESVGPLAFGTS